MMGIMVYRTEALRGFRIDNVSGDRRHRVLFIALPSGRPGYGERRRERYLHCTTLRTLGMQEAVRGSSRKRME